VSEKFPEFLILIFSFTICTRSSPMDRYPYARIVRSTIYTCYQRAFIRVKRLFVIYTFQRPRTRRAAVRSSRILRPTSPNVSSVFFPNVSAFRALPQKRIDERAQNTPSVYLRTTTGCSCLNNETFALNTFY